VGREGHEHATEGSSGCVQARPRRFRGAPGSSRFRTDEHSPDRPVLLAVDQELGEGARRAISPIRLMDPSNAQSRVEREEQGGTGWVSQVRTNQGCSARSVSTRRSAISLNGSPLPARTTAPIESPTHGGDGGGSGPSGRASVPGRHLATSRPAPPAASGPRDRSDVRRPDGTGSRPTYRSIRREGEDATNTMRPSSTSPVRSRDRVASRSGWYSTTIV